MMVQEKVPAPTGQKERVQSIDIVRGIIMVIMTIDHVRDYVHIHAMDDAPTNLATTTPILFFTRWFTHFCAPTFLFLSGISAFLAGQRKTKPELSLFLIKRGIWLVLADITIMTLALTFDPFFDTFFMLVFWSIGISMIILGFLVRTNIAVIITVGAIIFLGHNIFDYVKIPADNFGGRLLSILVTSRSFFQLGGGRILIIGYDAVTCSGLMLLGYGMGQLYNTTRFTAAQRQRALMIIGLAATFLFVVLRLINKYGDPTPWSTQKDSTFTLLSFINTNKYPMSLDFCCMTLGPSTILLALTERVKNKFTDFVSVYGKVPFFYFVVHFYLAHTIGTLLFFTSGAANGAKSFWDADTRFYFRPEHYGFPLWVVYVIWIAVVLIMYKPSKWFNRIRAAHSGKYWILKYM